MIVEALIIGLQPDWLDDDIWDLCRAEFDQMRVAVDLNKPTLHTDYELRKKELADELCQAGSRVYKYSIIRGLRCAMRSKISKETKKELALYLDAVSLIEVSV